MAQIQEKISTEGYHRISDMSQLSDVGCFNLLSEFCRFLSQDFQLAYKQMLAHPRDAEYYKHYENLRDVFTSDYFGKITGLCGHDIVTQLEAMTRKDFVYSSAS